MHYWLTEQAYRSIIVPTEKHKINLDNVNREIANHLKEPIQGITSEDRYDEIEAEAWDNLQELPGQ